MKRLPFVGLALAVALSAMACDDDTSDARGGSGPLAAAVVAPECFGQPADIVLTGGTYNGTNADEVIVGSANADTIFASGGNDRVCSLGGNDRLEGGLGSDKLNGGDGNDYLSTGGGATNTAIGGQGTDALLGGVGRDNLYGGTQDDELDGGENNDRLFGDKGDDDLNGGNGIDSCKGGPGADIFAECESTDSPSPGIGNLGTAAPNGIMAGTAVTCVIGGIINANISISPGSTVTGFPPCVITGVQHLNDAVAIQGQIDLAAAYNTLAGLPCPPANAIVANLGGTTKPAGVYCTAGGIGVTGTLTLNGGGNSNATFVFQAGSSLTTAGNIVLINGAKAKNVYWQVGSSATIGTASQWKGNILALTSITFVDNATLLGRALARNGAVSLGTNNVITLP